MPTFSPTEDTPTEDNQPEFHYTAYELVELYSIVIDRIEGNHIHGEIIGVDEDKPDQVIYSADEGPNNNIGKPLTLTGPRRPFLINRPFRIEFQLGKASGGHLSSWYHSYNPISSFLPANNNFIKVVSKCKGVGKATLTFGLISSGIEAHLRISFIGVGENKDMYPTHYCGQICVVHDELSETERWLYNTPLDDNNKSEVLLKAGRIPLSRSVIVAPTKKSLQMLIDLDAFYDDPSYDDRIAFVSNFTAPYFRQVTQAFAYSDRIRFEIFWKVPKFYAGNKAIEFDQAPCTPQRHVGYSRKKLAAEIAAQAKEMAVEAEAAAVAAKERAKKAIKRAEEEKTAEANDFSDRAVQAAERTAVGATVMAKELEIAEKRALKEADAVKLRTKRSSSNTSSKGVAAAAAAFSHFKL